MSLLCWSVLVFHESDKGLILCINSSIILIGSVIHPLVLGDDITTGMVHEGLSKAFEKTRRSLKTALKSKESQSTFNQMADYQQQKDILVEFAVMMSTETPPPGNALNNSMKQFHVSINECLHKEQTF